MDECEVPLQQLARLKEKLVRHSRAEDAAVKRIKDLEMQAFGLKAEVEVSEATQVSILLLNRKVTMSFVFVHQIIYF